MPSLKNKLAMPPAKDPMLEDEDLDMDFPAEEEEDMGPEAGEEDMEYPMSVEEMMKALEDKGYTVQEPEEDIEEPDMEEFPEDEELEDEEEEELY